MAVHVGEGQCNIIDGSQQTNLVARHLVVVLQDGTDDFAWFYHSFIGWMLV